MKKIIFTLLLLSACSTQTVIWEKPGADSQTQIRDKYECERDVRQGGYYGSGITADINMQEFYERCLIAKGWNKTITRSVSSNYKSNLSNAEKHCKALHPQLKLGEPKFNQCVASELN